MILKWWGGGDCDTEIGDLGRFVGVRGVVLSTMTSRIRIIHTVCGGTAFFYAERPRMDTMVIPAQARLVDGTTPKAGMTMRCGSCNELANLNDLIPEGGWA